MLCAIKEAIPKSFIIKMLSFAMHEGITFEEKYPQILWHRAECMLQRL